MGNRSFKSDFRRSFIKGLVVLLPTVLTLIILIQVYQFIQDSIGTPINDASEWLVTQVGLAPLFFDVGLSEMVSVDGVETTAIVDGIETKKIVDGVKTEVVAIPPLFGFVVAILIVYFVGSFFASFLGRKLLPIAERVLHKIPIFKVIYPYAKQVTDFFLEDKKFDYDLVVAVPYPRKGIYSIAFVTGDGMKAVTQAAGKQLVNVFIPSSPTPITGYTIFVDPEEIVPLDMTVDQALRFTISGGVIVPPSQVQPSRKPKIAQQPVLEVQVPDKKDPS